MARSNLKDTIAQAMDDEVEVDFSAATSGEFEPLPPGDYEVTVDECKGGESASGNPKVVFVFKLDEPLDGFTSTLFKHCPATGRGAGILRDVLRGLGFDVDKMTKFNPADAEGKQAIVTVRFQKDNPEFNEVTKVKAVPGKPAARRGGRSKLA